MILVDQEHMVLDGRQVGPAWIRIVYEKSGVSLIRSAKNSAIIIR